MSILKVTRIGHPVVRQIARTVHESEIRSLDFQRLIDDMIETMHDYDGVGLAAPQVHASLRLAIIEVPPGDERAGDAVPLSVLVNPTLTLLGGAGTIGWEGCLSIPDLRGQTPRFDHVRLNALDREGQPYVVEASGFHARVIQHECDHLEGKVYLDRMEDMRSLSFLREFERLAHENDDE
jgi:peptide deformylase